MARLSLASLAAVVLMSRIVPSKEQISKREKGNS
jgi:hypothetical protein